MRVDPIIAILLLQVFLFCGSQSAGSDSSNLQDQPALPPTPESSKGGYRLDFTLVEVEEDTDVTELAIRFFHGEIQRTHPEVGHNFTKLKCVQCHDVGQSDDPKPDFLWKTILDNRGALKTWVSDSENVSVLARPSLIVETGRTAFVDATSEESFDYLERREDGLFELKEKIVKTGISLRATVQTTDKEHQVRLNPVSVSVTAIKEREKIEGVKLPPVGRPILTTTSIETSLVAKLAESQIISIDSPRGGRVLIAVKVSKNSGRHRAPTSAAGGSVSLEHGTGLTASVSADFRSVPLEDALSQLAAKAGLKLMFDDGIARQWPVTIHLNEPILVKSALNLILEPLRLRYVAQDGHLIIRSE